MTCQSCSSPTLTRVLSLGMAPAVNDFRKLTDTPSPTRVYPLDLMQCRECSLVQLGFVPDFRETFPSSYPYTSSTTRALRENFADLATEANALIGLTPEGLVIDIGGNDGNLLSNFVGKQRVLNVTPEDIGALGVERGIPHHQSYWGRDMAPEVFAVHGPARLITATNVFAHTPDPNEFVEAVAHCLTPDGVFLSESHYLGAVVKGLQFDTIYTEHARIYSLASISSLLRRHGFHVAFAKTIQSHGGSIRVYATKSRGVAEQIARRSEDFRATRIFDDTFTQADVDGLGARVAVWKTNMWRLLSSIKSLGHRIVGIGAPSRASTLISYAGIDHTILDYICEVPGSHKLDSWMPGTRIPVMGEHMLFDEKSPPEFAMLLSHHVGSELMASLRAKGFKGRFIVPLPTPEVVQ